MIDPYRIQHERRQLERQGFSAQAARQIAAQRAGVHPLDPNANRGR